MLRYLRENTGNWIIKIFLGIIVIVFVFLGVGSFTSKQKDTVATIGDEPISIKEYQQAYKGLISQLQARFGTSLNDELIKAFNVKQQALERLVEQKLLLLEADKLNVSVSERELRDMLLSEKAFQKDGFFDMDTYKRVLSQMATNPEIFERNQVIAMTVDKIRKLITGNINVSDQEAKAFYTYQNTEMALDYVGFIPSKYTDIQIGKEALNKFYEKNKDNYKSPSKRIAVYLKFSPDDYKDQVQITDAHISDYYDQNIESFRTPEKVEARHILIRLSEDADDMTVTMAEKKADDIYQQAVGGADFQDLAREHSEGPSRESGGYLGTFDRASMVKPFADAAFALKPGEISPPVKTQFGLHIIKLVAKFDASVQTLVDVSEQIKNKLMQEEMQNIAYDLAGKAFDAVIDGDDFDQVALIANKTIIKTAAFDANANGLAIPDAKQFAAEAFALKTEDISDVKQFGDDYYLIKIVETIDPAIQPFETVAQNVEQDLKKKMQDDQAKADAKAYLDAATASKSLPATVSEKLTIESTKMFIRSGTIEGLADSSAIVRAAFTLSKENPIYSEPVKTSNGYYVLAFKDKKAPESEDIDKNISSVKQDLTYRKQTQSYQEWLAQLKEQYTIKYDPAVFN